MNFATCIVSVDDVDNSAIAYISNINQDSIEITFNNQEGNFCLLEEDGAYSRPSSILEIFFDREDFIKLLKGVPV